MTFADARGRRLAIVMPHPDDEAYAVAGTIAAATRAGAIVTLITATRGEAGWLREGFVDEPIAAVRTRELHCACAAMGIEPPRILDWPDGRLAEVDTTAARLTLTSLFEELSPDVIVTLASDGVYGHRDHVWLSERVAESAGERRLLHATFPKGLFSSFASRFRKLAPALLVDDMVPAALGADESSVDLVIDLDDEAVAAKRAAIACHRSQLVTDEPLVFLFPGLVEAVERREWLRLYTGTPLPAGATSPFAGLP